MLTKIPKFMTELMTGEMRKEERRKEKRIEAYLVSEQRNCFLFHMYNVYTSLKDTVGNKPHV